MTNIFFRKKIDSLTLKQVIDITESKLESQNIDLNIKITGIATLDSANQGEISFIHSPKYVPNLENSKAGFCLIEEKFLAKKPDNVIALISENPYFAYAMLLNHFYEENIDNKAEISKYAVVESSALIGKNVKIMAGAYIGHNAKIGDNSVIGANSAINDNVVIGQSCIIKNLVNISNSIIGNNAIIHTGAKIGQDGFGFVHNKGVNHKIIQIGIVEIGNDVEIGANSCIDRGAIGDTKIGNQVKIDNLVQIGHNVEIGDGTVMAGGTCVAGSTKIGRFCQIGGNSSINGHIVIGDGVKVAGASGIVKSVDAMQVVGGAPAMSIKDWHRMNLKLSKLIHSDLI